MFQMCVPCPPRPVPCLLYETNTPRFVFAYCSTTLVCFVAPPKKAIPAWRLLSLSLIYGRRSSHVRALLGAAPSSGTPHPPSPPPTSLSRPPLTLAACCEAATTSSLLNSFPGTSTCAAQRPASAAAAAAAATAAAATTAAEVSVDSSRGQPPWLRIFNPQNAFVR